MELKKTTIKGREIFVMFTGDKYYFHSNFYGTLAVATRQEKSEKVSTEFFKVYTGNRHTIGGQMEHIQTAVKRYINREENQFVQKEVKYTFEAYDLADLSIKISL